MNTKIIVLSFDIPRNKSSLRVKIWRELQTIGAKQRLGSDWTLPYSRRNLANFKSICKEIIKNGGVAEVVIGEII